jgi:hypothetical protein
VIARRGLVTLGVAAVLGMAACRRDTALAQTGDAHAPAPARLDGEERIAWDQEGKTLDEVKGFRYMAVIGQIPRDVEDVRCDAKSPQGPFTCSGKLPPIPNGIHELRLIAVAKDGPKNLISRWSKPLLVEKR